MELERIDQVKLELPIGENILCCTQESTSALNWWQMDGLFSDGNPKTLLEDELKVNIHAKVF